MALVYSKIIISGEEAVLIYYAFAHTKLGGSSGKGAKLASFLCFLEASYLLVAYLVRTSLRKALCIKKYF